MECRKNNRFILAKGVLLLAIFSVPTFAIEIAKHLTTIVDPVPVKRVNPKYPIEAARAGKTGWAKLSFVINEEGRVDDVIINEVVGYRGFGKEAKKAIRKWKYTPAMENGKPIKQCVNTVQMDFMMDNGGVSRPFLKKFNRAIDNLEKKDYDAFKANLDELAEYQYGNVNEIGSYHRLAAIYAEYKKDKAQQLFHLNRIKLDSTTDETKNLTFAILNKRFFLSISLNKFRQAYDIYEEIKALDIEPTKLKKYEQVIAQVDQFIGGPKDLIVKGNIKDKEFWQYSLVRNEFSLTNIHGSLNKLDIRCANKRHTYTVENNNKWSLPKTWKNCSLYVYGSDNADFVLVEHPIKS